jgi:hypothetical protein
MSVQTDLYDGIVEDVVSLTNRPDLAAEIAIAVRTATLSVHSCAAFPRDLVTQLVKIPNPSFQFSIDAQSQFPRMRGLSSVRPLDEQFNPVDTTQIEVVEIGDVFDPVYGFVKNNVAFLSGTNVNIKTDIASYGALVTYFQLPLIRREQYNSWIAQMAPDAIVMVAASLAFSTTGNEEKAASYMRTFEARLRPELIANFLTSAMR